MKLDDRKKRILASVVEDYVTSAEPVGSKTIADRYNLEYSSATIRNDMKLLEESGYLEQPHVSSGRIPSSKGYRYYVDNLMQSQQLSMLDINYINNSITGYGNTEDLFEQVADTVSKILNRPTILTMKNEDILESIKILKISDKILLVIIMSENGTIKDVVAKLTDTIPDDSVKELSKLLNTNLQGTPIEKLYNVLSSVISKELKLYSNVLEKICEGIKHEMSGDNKIVSNNLESILDMPEFANIDKAKNFINMLSTKNAVDTVIDKIENNDVGIVIGSENLEIMLKDYSIISLNLENGDGYSGKLSVVSPKRLDYSKTVSTLKYINEKVKNILSKDK
ncbi:MAG: heat-inducible transcriptional repressor HrcA [Clostridia bacterium]